MEEGLWRGQNRFSVDGYCPLEESRTRFAVATESGEGAGGPAEPPNWQETLVCPRGFTNRLCSTRHLLIEILTPGTADRIYATEQRTALFHWLKGRYPRTSGSESLAGQGWRKRLCLWRKGVRHADLTLLPFRDHSFEFILSGDCLEHLPHFREALRECRRCLVPGGRMLLTVPFVPELEDHRVRAEVAQVGGVVHHLPPEWHGDPVRGDGCLCFTYFVWRLLEDLREAGFADACAVAFWSQEYGYLGGEQFAFLATA